MGQNRFFLPSRTLLVYQHAVWVTQRPWHIPAYNGRYSPHLSIAICPCIFSEQCDLFQITIQKLVHVCKVLMFLRNARVTIKVEKCQFFTKTIEFLEHVIRPRLLEIAWNTTNTISELQQPANLTELQTFLELCTVFRRLAPNFADMAAHLNTKLQKD